jgi:hypothetical protein
VPGGYASPTIIGGVLFPCLAWPGVVLYWRQRWLRPSYCPVLRAYWTRGVAQATAPAMGHLPQPSAAWDTRLASVELMCSRLLGLDLSAMGRGLSTTGYAAAQVWY